jgi:hypothetical protein
MVFAGQLNVSAYEGTPRVLPSNKGFIKFFKYKQHQEACGDLNH